MLDTTAALTAMEDLERAELLLADHRGHAGFAGSYAEDCLTRQEELTAEIAALRAEMRELANA